MKFLKAFGLFFIYPLIMLGIGFLTGIMSYDYFYPGQKNPVRRYEAALPENVQPAEEQKLSEEMQQVPQEQDLIMDVSVMEETLNADTKYIIQEMDMDNNSVLETEERVPSMYLGMNREQFLLAMEQYAAFPPLSEKERGFVSLEVKSFSTQRVVVQMNYQYVQPSKSFYLAVADNELVVLLEDQKTVYIHTGIRLEDLPENVQHDIINMRFVENEEKLFNFLEAYSS